MGDTNGRRNIAVEPALPSGTIIPTLWWSFTPPAITPHAPDGMHYSHEYAHQHQRVPPGGRVG